MKFDELVYFMLSGKVLKHIKCARHTFTTYPLRRTQTPEVIFYRTLLFFRIHEIRARVFQFKLYDYLK